MEDIGATRSAATKSNAMSTAQERESCHVSGGNDVYSSFNHAPGSAELKDGFVANNTSHTSRTARPFLDASFHHAREIKTAPIWFHAVGPAGGPPQFNMTDPRNNTYRYIGEHDRSSYYHRCVDSNMPCTWQCGVPMYLGPGMRSDLNMHEAPYPHSNSLPNQEAHHYYALPQPPAFGAGINHFVDPGLLFSKPSPAPTLSNCSTFSDSLSNASVAFDQTDNPSRPSSSSKPTYAHITPAQQVAHQVHGDTQRRCNNYRGRTADRVQGSSMATPSYQMSFARNCRAGQAPVQGYSHPWDSSDVQLGESRIRDRSGPLSYANCGSSFSSVSNDNFSRATSLVSVHSNDRNYTIEQFRPSAQHASYPIAPRVPAVSDNEGSSPDNGLWRPLNSPEPSNEPEKGHENVQTSRHRKIPAKRRAPHRSKQKDRFLIRSRALGMSYKEIKEKGNFTEAESTLRGRYRMLTKEKEKRVRRPRWTDTDVLLLKEAIATFGTYEGTPKGTNSCRKEMGELKVSWNKVADYISDKGGSYHFGIGTCRKKWDEIQE